MTNTDYVDVAACDEIAPNTSKLVTVGEYEVLVCNSGGSFYAIENRCSHAEQPLYCGRIKDGWIACPFHGARFELATGEALSPPAEGPVRTFSVRVRQGRIEVK